MSDNLAFAPATFCVSKATLAASTTTTFSTTGATLYSINGKAFSTAAAGAGTATPTTDANTGAAFVALQPNRGCVFVFAYNGNGVAATGIRVVQGPIEVLDGTLAGASASFINAPQFPVVPDNLCAFAYVVTKVGASGAAWTFGVSNLAGPPANTLHTFVDIMTIPGRPQVA